MAKIQIPEKNALVAKTKTASSYLNERDTAAIADEFGVDINTVRNVRKGANFNLQINLKIIELAEQRSDRVAVALAANI